MTQNELMEHSGVSLRSISRLEQGNSIQTDNLIKVLTALGLGNNIELLVPDQTRRPSYYLEDTKKNKQRARKKKVRRQSFVLGDEK